MPDITRSHFTPQVPLGLPGVILPQALVGTPTSAILTANRAYFNRLYLERPLTISGVGFSVGTAATNDDPCDVGILNAAGTLLTSVGATSGKLNAGTGMTSVTLPYAFNAYTVYYVAFSCGAVGGTAASLAMATFSGANTNIMWPFGGTPPNAVTGIKAATHPLVTTTTFSFGNVPILTLIKA